MLRIDYIRKLTFDQERECDLSETIGIFYDVRMLSTTNCHRRRRRPLTVFFFFTLRDMSNRDLNGKD